MKTVKLNETLQNVTVKEWGGDKLQTFKAFGTTAEAEGRRFVTALRKNASKSFVDGVVAELKKRKL